MPLVNLDEVKDMLGVTSSDRDTQYAALIPAVERLVKNWTRNQFARATYTEYLTGNGRREILLRHRPVASITTVHVNDTGRYGDGPGSFDADALLTAGTDYSLKRDWTTETTGDSGILVRHNGVWPMVSAVSQFGYLSSEPGPSYGNIKVVYVAGYDPIPEDVKWAIAQIIEWFRSFNLGIEKERIGDYMVEYSLAKFDAGSDMAGPRRILSQYREPNL